MGFRLSRSTVKKTPPGTEQSIGIRRETEASGMKSEEVCRSHIPSAPVPTIAGRGRMGHGPEGSVQSALIGEGEQRAQEQSAADRVGNKHLNGISLGKASSSTKVNVALSCGTFEPSFSTATVTLKFVPLLLLTTPYSIELLVDLLFSKRSTESFSVWSVVTFLRFG